LCFELRPTGRDRLDQYSHESLTRCGHAKIKPKIKDEEENAKMVEGTSSFCGICGHFKPAKQEKYRDEVVLILLLKEEEETCVCVK
jgi:mannose-6-phosphate isomerase class I